MAWAITAFDALLVALLFWLAWQAIYAKGLFRAVISFIIFGLLMAVAWVRLEAPDIALAVVTFVSRAWPDAGAGTAERGKVP